jgi:hypothetical protein
VIYGIWEGLFIVILLTSLILGILKGGFRTLTFFSAHLFPFVLALVFSPFLGELFITKSGIGLNSLFPIFLLVYFFPMLLLTQLVRVMYRKTNRDPKKKPSFLSCGSGFIMGILTGALFSFLFTWLILLQPWVHSEVIYGQGGTVFTHVAGLLQYFMRFYV